MTAGDRPMTKADLHDFAARLRRTIVIGGVILAAVNVAGIAVIMGIFY